MANPRKVLHDVAIAITGAVSKLIPDRVPMTLLGPGSSKDLCSAIAQAGTKKLLIVTDRMLVRLGLVAGITASLEESGVAWCIYDGVEPDPTSEHVAAGLEVLRRERCDAVLAVGGGSPMDAAKVIAAAATNDKPLHKLEGLLKVRRPPLPLYAIPTTAGTGSEVTIAAVVSDPVTHKKKFFVDPKLLPLMTALDPALMTGLPPAITAATGMDALTHAVESYLSKTSNVQTERWASAAIRLIFANLPRAYRNGNDIQARSAMALASYYAGLAFTRTSVGYVHAIAHQLGAHYRTPHGLANATVLPHVLDYSIEPARRRMADMARMIGIEGTNDATLASAFVDSVRELARTVEIPPVLEDLQVQDIPDIARAAIAEAFMNYPVPRYMETIDCEQVIRGFLART
ncbi:MAG TPA: iron-containing alcohol dehydrogenase [Candidatus Binatia bacterium]|jgi:alcohol dehydrogenase class IV